jgi:hypothetical protein
MRAADGRNQPGDENEEIVAARHPGLGEDVIAMRPRRGFGNAEGAGGFSEACAGEQML